MTRKEYLKQHAALTQRLKRAGLPYPRRVFWQIPQRSAKRYEPQIRAMKSTVKGIAK